MRLRLLVEVDRRGSVSAAAEACRVSQPSATKHLKTLQAAVGESLLERDGRGSRLTEAGRLAATYAAQALDVLDTMQAELHALRGVERGTLALAASTTPGTYLLPAVLGSFAERHPGVDVEVMIGSSAWVAERVARRETALGVAGEVDLPAGVVGEPFLRDELVGIAAPGRLRLRRGRVSLADLSSETLLVRERESSTRAVAERYLTRLGFVPLKQWELDSNEAIKRSVGAGLGVGFVSELVVEDEAARGDLVTFRISGADPMRRSVQLLRPSGREPSASERAFITTLREWCEREGPATARR